MIFNTDFTDPFSDFNILVNNFEYAIYDVLDFEFFFYSIFLISYFIKIKLFFVLQPD